MGKQPVTERRQWPRILVRVLVDFESPDTYLYDYSNDLSEGGIFIETEKPLPSGTPLTLRYTLPGIDRVFEAKGKVAWVNVENEAGDLAAKSLSPGMGVEFVDMDETDRNLVKEYVDKALASQE